MSERRVSRAILHVEKAIREYSREEIARMSNEERFVLVDELTKSVKEWRKRAKFDPLTGLYRREVVEEIINRAIAFHKEGKCDLAKSRLCVVMYDLVDFSRFNNGADMGVGDYFLCQFKEEFAKHVRNVDVFGRWGGDEFVQFSLGITRERIMQVLGSINADLRLMSQHKGIGGNPLVARCGWAFYEAGDTAATMAIRASAMIAKRKRREKMPA